MASRHLLIMFAKAPVAGKVKTRLQPPLSAEEAAELHACFLLDQAERLLAPSGELVDFDGWLSLAGSGDHPVVAEIVKMGVTVVAQRGDGLGDRMACAIEEGLAAGYESVTLIGSDSPTLPASLVLDAVGRLAEVDVAFGPSFDGGFTLISARCPLPELRGDITWSVVSTLSQTFVAIEQAKHLGALVGFWYDVDQKQDLEFLTQHLPGLAGPETAPRTARWLVEHAFDVT